MKSLTTQISRLRKVLEPEGVTVSHSAAGYRLGLPAEGLDLERFEAAVSEAKALSVQGFAEQAIRCLSEALQLWRGEPLEDLTAFPFARSATYGLTHLKRSVEDDLVRLMLGSGSLISAIDLLHRLVDEAPYDERRWSWLVRALAGIGRRDEALAAFEKVRSLLRTDLGVEPGEELHEAELAVRSGHAVDAERIADVVPEGIPFVGRLAEVQQLMDSLSAAMHGLRISLVEGEAGIGKTRLVREFADRARRMHAIVLVGACEPHRLVPLRSLLSALDPVLTQGTSDDLDPVDPVLRELLSSSAPPPRSETEGLDLLRYRVMRAIGEMLQRLSTKRPVVLLLEDMQWADPFTISVLHHVISEHREAPILIVCTSRVMHASDDTEAGRIQPFWTEANARVPFERLELRPLAREEVRAIVEHLAPGVDDLDETATRIERASGGNALFASQLAMDVSTRGFPHVVPHEAQTVCRTRVGVLSPGARSFLRAAAVVGDRFERRLVDEMIRGEQPLAAGVVSEAVAARLIRPSERFDHYEFVHGVVREVILDDLEDSYRRHLHMVAAVTMDPDGSDVVERARHFVAGLPDTTLEATYDATLLAGRRSAARGSLEAAAEMFRAAADVAPSETARAEARIDLGSVLIALGQGDAGHRELDEASDRAREEGRWDLVADAVLARANIAFSGAMVDALARAADAETILQHLAATDRRRRLLLGCWRTHLLTNLRPQEALTALTEAERLAGEIDEHELRNAVTYARIRHEESQNKDPAVWGAAAEALIARAREQGDDVSIARGHLALQAARLRRGEYSRCAAENLSFLEHVRTLHHPALEVQLEAIDVAVAMATRPLREANRESRRLGEIGMSRALPSAVISRAMQSVIIRREQCRLAELEPVLRAAQQAQGRQGMYAMVVAARVEAGDMSGATDALEWLLSSDLASLDRDWAFETSLALAADVAYDVGIEHPALESLARALEPSAGHVVVLTSYIGIFGRVDRYLGRLAHLAGDLDTAVDRFEQARQADTASGSDLWAGWAARDEAAARLARGLGDDRDQARTLLALAEDYANHVGSERLRRAVGSTAAV